ncbi:MAG: DUF2750 domain-containing protein [Rickettsiaceae bacterium]|nr:DUF2750 domain-containing protein [Rickettsiaceae bacterium]
MKTLNKHAIDRVINLNAKERYDYFVKKVVDSEKLWGLFDGGWALVGDINQNVYLPLWPDEEFAEMLTAKEWNGYSPKEIDLYEFVDKIVHKLESTNVSVCVFLTHKEQGVCIPCRQLVFDLKRAM